MKAKKVNYNGYKGYQYTYNDITYIIWDGSYSTKANWYISVTESNVWFSERDLDGSFNTKEQADKYIKSLINTKNS